MSTNGGPFAAASARRPARAGSWTRWWDGVPAQVTDALVAVTSVALSMALLAVSEEPGRSGPDAIAHVLLVVAAAPIAARRRLPGVAVLTTAVTAVAYLALGYPGGPVTVPVLVALYGAAAEGRRTPALVVLGFFAGIGSAHRLAVQQEPVVTVAFQGLLFVFSWLLGEFVNSRRALRAEVDARLRRAEEEREREAARRVQQERLRIARELHDVLAHTVSSMTVQAGAAADLLEDRPHAAREALVMMRRAGKDAMAELRATVSLLRAGDDGSPRPPAPGLVDLDSLVERATRDGLTVELVTIGEWRQLPAAVELTGYRIVQEALTNVVRHAMAHHARVTVCCGPDELTIEVADDGRGASHVHAGFGLLGMRERAEAVGGQLTAGPREGGGFLVEAQLPTGERDHR